MKLWIINHYAVPPNQTGGTRHFTLAQQFLKCQHQVTIISGDFNHFSQCHEAPQSQIIKHEIIDDVPFTWIKTPSYRGNGLRRLYNMLIFAWRLFRHRKQLATQPPDVIYASTPDLFSALAGYFIARSFNCEYNLEVRDLWPKTLIDVGNLHRFHPLVLLFKIIEIKLYRSAKRIFTLLPNAAEYITGLGIPADKIIYTPNFVTKLTQPRTHQTMSSSFKYVYVGSMGKANNLTLLLEAIAICKQQCEKQPVEFTLIGDGPAKKDLLELAQNEGLDNITFQDAVSKQVVPEHLKQADAAIIVTYDSPLYQYGFSFNKLFDYLQAGLPILFVGQYQYNPIEEYRLGVCVSHDRNEIAKALLQLPLQKDLFTADFTQRCRHFLGANYTVESVFSVIAAELNCHQTGS